MTELTFFNWKKQTTEYSLRQDLPLQWPDPEHWDGKSDTTLQKGDHHSPQQSWHRLKNEDNKAWINHEVNVTNKLLKDVM